MDINRTSTRVIIVVIILGFVLMTWNYASEYYRPGENTSQDESAMQSDDSLSVVISNQEKVRIGGNSNSGSSRRIDSKPFLSQSAFEESLADQYIQSHIDYKGISTKESMDVIAGILPHHSVARVLIADFYKSISMVNEYDLIILISPNHQSIGPRFQVGTTEYDTFDGTVSVADELAELLIESTEARRVLDEVIEDEHGQLVHMPYIKRFFPESDVLSLVLVETRESDGIEAFAEVLKKLIVDKKTLIIGSIDFSHYLNYEEASVNDRYTKALIESEDYLNMIGLSNDYIDSPSTYMLLMLLIKGIEGRETIITHQSNSAVLLDDYMMGETTSYFQVLYRVCE